MKQGLTVILTRIRAERVTIKDYGFIAGRLEINFSIGGSQIFTTEMSKEEIAATASELGCVDTYEGEIVHTATGRKTAQDWLENACENVDGFLERAVKLQAKDAMQTLSKENGKAHCVTMHQFATMNWMQKLAIWYLWAHRTFHPGAGWFQYLVALSLGKQTGALEMEAYRFAKMMQREKSEPTGRIFWMVESDKEVTQTVAA